MNKIRSIIMVLLLATSLSSTIGAVNIKLASVAPEASPIGEALNRMASEWRRITNGAVTVRVFHNALAGGEEDVIRKIRIGQLQAGIFTSQGLSLIEPSTLTLSAPMLIANNEEYEYVLNQIRPTLEGRIEDQGYKVIGWNRAGWIRFFSKEPFSVPDDLRNRKLAVGEGEESLFRAFDIMGFRPTIRPGESLLTPLNSGTIDTVFLLPYVFAALQLFGVVPHMLDLEVAPVMGAILIDQRVWNRIPDQYHRQLQESAEQIANEMQSEIARLEQEAIETMEQYGLEVERVTPAIDRIWREDLGGLLEETVGPVFDPEIYREIERSIQQYRNGR